MAATHGSRIKGAIAGRVGPDSGPLLGTGACGADQVRSDSPANSCTLHMYTSYALLKARVVYN